MDPSPDTAQPNDEHAPRARDANENERDTNAEPILPPATPNNDAPVIRLKTGRKRRPQDNKPLSAADVERMFVAWFEANRNTRATARAVGVAERTVQKYRLSHGWDDRAAMASRKVTEKVVSSLADRVTKSRSETVSALEVWRRMVMNKALQSAGIEPGTPMTPEIQKALGKAVAKIKDADVGKELKIIAEVERIVCAPLDGSQQFKGEITGEISHVVKGGTLADLVRAATTNKAMAI